MHKPSSARLHTLPVVVTSLLVRLAVVWFTARSHSAEWFFGQARELPRLAESLRIGQGLSSPFGCCTGPSAFLAPGYPAVIAAFFAVFHPYSFSAAVAVMVFQALCGSATVLILMVLTRRLFGARTANLAGLIWALSPPAIFLPILFWETSLSILFAASLTLLALHCAEQPSLRRWLLAGLVAALAIAVNPSLLSIILCCYGWAFYRTYRQSIVAPASGLLLLILLSTPWPIRNYRQLHAFIPTRTNMGYELWQGNRPGSVGFFVPELHPNTSPMEFSRYRELGEVAYMREKNDIAMRTIRANPGRFLKMCAVRAVHFWTGGGHVFLIICYICFTTLVGCAGLLLLWRRSHSMAVFFLMPMLLFPLPYYITHPDFRFRLVLDPIMAALTAYALTRNRELLDL